jgi:hypothetical protein
MGKLELIGGIQYSSYASVVKVSGSGPVGSIDTL